jgi:Uncharacterised nucleotidyltransferase
VRRTALLIRLLRYASASSSQNSPHRSGCCPLDGVDNRQIRWVLDAGLGPLLYLAVRDCIDDVPASWRDVLLSADLTARVRHGNLVDTAEEVIDVCQELQVRPTLLKGISISEQHYPVAHLRPMGDIDVLIPKDAYESVESALLRRGFIRKADYTVSRGAKHGIPLFCPERHVWVELHTALFDQDSFPDEVFSVPNVGTQLVASTFRGQNVYRLTDELQLLYIASSWFADLARYNIVVHPSGVAPLLDVVLLLKRSGKSLDYTRLAVDGDSEMAMASLHVMLGYLARHGFDSDSHRLLRALSSRQQIAGPLQRRIIYAVLDRYLIGGRPWNLLFPIPVPGRYSVRHQLRKRLRGGRYPSQMGDTGSSW